MTTFSHSGTFGDLVYALGTVKHLGGGDFFLRLTNMDNMAKEVLGPHANAGQHSGEMTKKQFDSLTSFMLSQPYIKSWNVWNGEEIDYALEYSGHEICKQNGNYAAGYARYNGINFEDNYKELMLKPWLEIKDPIKIPGRPVVVNRVNRHLYGCDPELNGWKEFIRRGLSEVGIYVGLASEHAWFEQTLGIKIPHYATTDVLECARVIAGAEQFIGSQSMCLSLAVGLGKTFFCERRKDLPLERNECFYARPNAHYF